MKIAVVGTGYVGLVTAACLAELGHTVTGVDIDVKKIDVLKRGESPIYEPGLEELLREGIAAGRLSFTTDLVSVLPGISLLFSAVATPAGEGHQADLRAVFAVADTVAMHAEKNLLFVNKSTVPVGTGQACEERIEATLKRRGTDIRVSVLSNPEFLREGMAVTDTLMPERIIVGLNDNPDARELMEELYRPITRVGKPLIFMRRESAEIVKYACNAFLATKISFVNMLTPLTEQTGANIREVALGMGLDSRIGPRFLHAGIGYGGSCFPKDVLALLATGKALGVAMPIIEGTDAINTVQRERFVERILDLLPHPSRIAVWGLSFKPKTDDLRDAPSLDIIPSLLSKQHTITAHDPVSMSKAKLILPQKVSFAASPLEAAKDADAVLVLTEWDSFRGVDLHELKRTMRGNHLFDGRNIYEREDALSAGLQYHGIG